MPWPTYTQLAAPPTWSQQAEAIKALLLSYTEINGGDVKVMANMSHLWQYLLELNDDEPQILIVCNGEISRGGFNQANTLHRVDRQWLVVIIRGHGFDANLSEMGDAVNEPAFYDVVETIRDGLRCMENISEEFPIDFKAIRSLPIPSNSLNVKVFIDGYLIEFSTANDIPAINRV